jgi:hypothetical protein
LTFAVGRRSGVAIKLWLIGGNMGDQQLRDVDVLDRTLRDVDTPTRTRRWLLQRAAAGAAVVTAAGALEPAATALAQAPGSAASIRAFGTVAVTTEALTVTLATELLRRINLHPEVPASTKAVFQGVYAAELDHLRFTRAHWRPTTTRFWIPDAVFGGSGNALSLTAVGNALVHGEEIFTSLYLIGITTFAAARRSSFARFSGELAGVESEHRVLAATLINATPPNDRGFAAFTITTPSGIVRALEAAGIGFGKQGATPGAFYTLARPPMAPPLPIKFNRPQ